MSAAALQTVPTLLPLWAEVTVAALVLIGALVALLGSFGLLRLRSFFERIHAPAIIATLGCWCVMYGALLNFSFRGQGLAVLATIVCITPGTVWAELSLDRSMLLLHVLEVDDAAAIAAHVKQRYERPLMEIFE